MNNEIKEILDNIKKCCEIMQDENFVVYQKQDIIKLLDYITNLQEINNNLKEDFKRHIDRINELTNRIEKAVEYIENNTRWFDSEYASVYGELCNCAGANANRLEVVINSCNLLNILNGRSDE